MDGIIKTAFDYALNDIDIQKVTRNQAKILFYKDLVKYNNIIDAIGDTGQLVLLFPTDNAYKNNHWIALLYHSDTNTVEHFDSYGLSPVQEQSYSTNDLVKQGVLNKLIKKSINDGYRFVSNDHRLQEMARGIDDCGRYASLRCRFHYLSRNEFASMFLNQKESPDWLVTCLTFMLCKDEVNEEARIKKLAKLWKQEMIKINQKPYMNINQNWFKEKTDINRI